MVEVCAVFCYCLLHIGNRCVYMAHVCFISVIVTVWVCGNVVV